MLMWETRRYLQTVGRLFWWKAVRLIRPRRLPCSPDGQLRIHLGCGPIDSAGFVNIDLIPLPHIHYLSGVTPLEMFADGQADLIYASHMLEHLSLLAAPAALKEWHRILKPGGVLRLGVPDFRKLVNIYDKTERVEDIIVGIVGGQLYETDFHQSVYDDAYLRRLLLATGFREVRPWDPETAPYHDFRDTTSHEFVVRGERHPISLNLEAVK